MMKRVGQWSPKLWNSVLLTTFQECVPYLLVCTGEVALELLEHCIARRWQIKKSSPKLFGVALERCTGE